MDLIITGSEHITLDVYNSQRRIKNQVILEKQVTVKHTITELIPQLEDKHKRLMEISSEKGASSWLTVLPIKEHGFLLHKGSFRDALCVRYGWQLPYSPTNCSCQKPFSVDHCLSCPNGGYVIHRHNEICDLTAQFLKEICHDASVEPQLQPLSEESLTLRSANRDVAARLDVSVTDFWERNGQKSFFDIRVFNPLAPSNLNVPLMTSYRNHELEKRRVYDQRIREIEHGCFSPLVFNTLGGFSPTATIVYKRIASRLSEKLNLTYNVTVRWVRCMISFSLLRSTITLLRGSRQKIPLLDLSTISVAMAEGRGLNMN